jgi:outer membrane protein TolC
MQTAASRKLAVDRSLYDSERLLDLTRQKYEKGVVNKLTVLNALENAFVQQDLHVQIQLAHFESAVELIRAIGGGYYDTCFP